MRAATILHCLFLSQLGALWPAGSRLTNRITSRTPIRDDGVMADMVVGVAPGLKFHVVVRRIDEIGSDRTEAEIRRRVGYRPEEDAALLALEDDRGHPPTAPVERLVRASLERLHGEPFPPVAQPPPDAVS